MAGNLTPHQLSIEIRAEALDALTELADSYNLDWTIIKEKRLVVTLPEIVEEEL